MAGIPPVLRVLLVAMVLQIAIDAVGLGLGWGDRDWAGRGLETMALVFDVALAVLLVGGREWVRRLLRLAAALGFAIDAVLVTLWFAYARSGTAGTLAGVAAIVLLIGSAFTWWALGHATVQAWVFERWLTRRGL